MLLVVVVIVMLQILPLLLPLLLLLVLAPPPHQFFLPLSPLLVQVVLSVVVLVMLVQMQALWTRAGPTTCLATRALPPLQAQVPTAPALAGRATSEPRLPPTLRARLSRRATRLACCATHLLGAASAKTPTIRPGAVVCCWARRCAPCHLGGSCAAQKKGDLSSSITRRR